MKKNMPTFAIRSSSLRKTFIASIFFCAEQSVFYITPLSTKPCHDSSNVSPVMAEVRYFRSISRQDDHPWHRLLYHVHVTAVCRRCAGKFLAKKTLVSPSTHLPRRPGGDWKQRESAIKYVNVEVSARKVVSRRGTSVLTSWCDVITM